MASPSTPRVRGSFLLRVANVNPDSVYTHSDRVLYSSIGMFILLYFVYATIGGAAFVDASSNYSHPWWRWLVGPLVALAVIAYDRAVVGRVAISLANPESEDPEHLLRRRTLSLYLGRGLLALLVAVVVTEPLMLDRYQGEIEAYLQKVQNAESTEGAAGGPVKVYEDEKNRLAGLDAAADEEVARLRTLAGQKRDEAQRVYDQAMADSKGDGVSRKPGCPAGGYCDTLVARSRTLQAEASALDEQANQLRAGQQADRDERNRQRADLDRRIDQAKRANIAAIEANAGFGARTKAMWYLIRTDFAGIGLFYLGTALLLIALDCAAIGLKFASHGSSYERAEARRARRRELEENTLHSHSLRAARTAADAYAEATTSIVNDGIQAAAEEKRLRDVARRQARTRLRAVISNSMDGSSPAVDGERRNVFRLFGQRRAHRDAYSPWPGPEYGDTGDGYDDEAEDDATADGGPGGRRRWNVGG